MTMKKEDWPPWLPVARQIGRAVGWYVFALVVLELLHELVHDTGSGGIWWAGVILAVLFYLAYSFGRFRGGQKPTKPGPEKQDKEFNLPL